MNHYVPALEATQRYGGIRGAWLRNKSMSSHTFDQAFSIHNVRTLLCTKEHLVKLLNFIPFLLPLFFRVNLPLAPSLPISVSTQKAGELRDTARCGVPGSAGTHVSQHGPWPTSPTLASSSSSHSRVLPPTPPPPPSARPPAAVTRGRRRLRCLAALPSFVHSPPLVRPTPDLPLRPPRPPASASSPHPTRTPNPKASSSVTPPHHTAPKILSLLLHLRRRCRGQPRRPRLR
jgi:hypothetical protein